MRNRISILFFVKLYSSQLSRKILNKYKNQNNVTSFSFMFSTVSVLSIETEKRAVTMTILDFQRTANGLEAVNGWVSLLVLYKVTLPFQLSIERDVLPCSRSSGHYILFAELFGVLCPLWQFPAVQCSQERQHKCKAVVWIFVIAFCFPEWA